MNGSYKFKKSGSANAAEKRNRTDSEGRSGFGATTNRRDKFKSPPRPTVSYDEFRNAKNKTTRKGMGIFPVGGRRRGAK
jgi:hypothetical protein